MIHLLIAVTTLSLVVLQTNAACTEVGCCVTIESHKWKGWFLYDSGQSGQYWVYTSKTPSQRSHQWKVKWKKVHIQKFQNMQYPDRCLCEREGSFWAMYAATCDCKDGDRSQEWDLQGKSDIVKFMRPGGYRYFLSHCASSCAFITTKQEQWILTPCKTE
jgi:hypothetical protein